MEFEEQARAVHRALQTRLELASILYDYAKQLEIRMIAKPAMNEFFNEKKGYNVFLFGILGKGRRTHRLR